MTAVPTYFPPGGCAGFPATGPYSSRGAPAVAGSGEVPVTQVAASVNTRWARSALAAATVAGLSASGSIQCGLAAASSGGAAYGSAFQNPPGSAASPALADPDEDFFDLGASAQVASAAADSLTASVATLGTVVALQSCVGGFSEAQAAAASTAFRLVEAALSAAGPAAALLALRAAAQVSAGAVASTATFSGVMTMAASGQVGSGDPDLGRALSGSLGALAARCPTADVLGAVPAALVALTPQQQALASTVLSITGGLAPVLPTPATPSQFAAQYPASPTSGGPAPAGIGAAMASLQAATVASVGLAIASALGLGGAAAAALSGLQLAVPGAASPRGQSLGFIEGPPAVPSQPAGQAVDGGQLMMQAMLAALAAFAPSASSPGGGAAGALPPGTLGGSGSSASTAVQAALAGSYAGASSLAASLAGSLASSAAAAAALGAQPPSTGDLQAAGFGQATGLGGSAADPSAAAAAAASMLADGCAFGASLGSALSQAAALVSAAGAVTPAVQSALEGLQETLQCRSSAYSAAAKEAYAAAGAGAARYTRLLGAAQLLGAYGGIVASNCPPGNGPAGSC